MAAHTHNKPQNEEKHAPPEPPQQEAKYQAHVPADIRNVSFPVGVRGYEKKAVEAYVRKVNRVIAELEVTRSPQAAVRHAVERVEEQTKSILEEARASAEKITGTAQSEADEIIAQAKANAADLVVGASTESDRIKAESDERVAQAKAQAERIVAEAKANADQHRREVEEELAKMRSEAEARMKELEADTATLWDRRHELLGDIDRMADQLHDAAREAAGRLPRVGAEREEPDSEPTEILPKQPKSKKPSRAAH
jgi:DivIVA domain-containing protein